MTTRYANPVEVPLLKQKLGALYLLSPGVAGDAALGGLFRSDDDPEGITGKAIRNWIYGEGERPPGHVPAGRFERIVEIFADRMPGRRTREEVRAMLLAPSEREVVLGFLASAPPVDWMALVLAARPSRTEVVLAGRPGVLALTTRHRAIEGIGDGIRIPVGEQFRFALEAASGWLSVVQWGTSGWFGLELGDGSVALPLSSTRSLIPPSRPYFEERELGNRRYLFIRTAQLPPPDVRAFLALSAQAEASLDAGALVRLAHLAGAQDAEITALDLTFISQ